MTHRKCRSPTVSASEKQANLIPSTCFEAPRPDTCDIAGGTDEDDNGNGTPDACEIAQGDLNLDGCIDSGDLGLLIALWNVVNPPFGDLNGDGVVGPADLGLLIGNWTPCGP